jgi:hypothetical protein
MSVRSKRSPRKRKMPNRAIVVSLDGEAFCTSEGKLRSWSWLRRGLKMRGQACSDCPWFGRVQMKIIDAAGRLTRQALRA